MKKIAKITGAAATVPFILAACAPEENGENDPGNNAGNNQNATNEENEESASAQEVEELADEYGLDVTVNDNGDMSDDAVNVSLEELEEAFEFISTASDADMLEFQESPHEGEAEESGAATGEYAVPGAETDNIDADIHVTFEYELGGDLDDESRIPSFENVSDEEVEIAGDGLITWSDSSTESEVTAAGTIAEITSEGEWLLVADYEGTEVEVNEQDEWMTELDSATLVGIEEEEA